jgi:hypothetical protein
MYHNEISSPATMVHPLPQQLHRRLRAVHLQRRHVQVVHKYDGLRARGTFSGR